MNPEILDNYKKEILLIIDLWVRVYIMDLGSNLFIKNLYIRRKIGELIQRILHIQRICVNMINN